MKRLPTILALLLLPAMMAACADGQASQQSGNADKQGSQQPVNIANQTATKSPAATNVPAPTIAPTPATGAYDIAKATYADKKITISYPQLSNLSDSGKQKRINDLIKTAALEVLEPYKADTGSLSLNVDFGLKSKGTTLLSIQYLGLATVQGAAHPNGVIHTANIDLKAERRLTLSDAVTVNDGFVKQFLAGKYTPYSSSLNLQSAGALEGVLARFDNKDLMASFSRPTTEFYFTDDSLGVSVEVAHALGDHLEMEIGYGALGNSLLVNPEASQNK